MTEFILASPCKYSSMIVDFNLAYIDKFKNVKCINWDISINIF